MVVDEDKTINLDDTGLILRSVHSSSLLKTVLFVKEAPEFHFSSTQAVLQKFEVTTEQLPAEAESILFHVRIQQFEILRCSFTSSGDCL